MKGYPSSQQMEAEKGSMKTALPDRAPPWAGAEPNRSNLHAAAEFSPRLYIIISALAYFMAQELSFMFPDVFGLMAAIWPVGGIGLAALLLSPRRLWPMLLCSLFVAGMAANLTTSRPAAASLGFMIANICETAASAWLITRWGGISVSFNRVREVTALAAAVFLVNTATALIGAETARLAIGASFWKVFWTWWVTDGLGLLLVTPLIVVLARSGATWKTLSWKRRAEAFGLIVFSCLVAWGEFGSKKVLEGVELAPFWLPVFLIWAALRFGSQFTVVLLSAFSFIVIGCTAAGLGSFPLGGADDMFRLLAVQVYLGVMGMSGLVLAAAIAQQREVQALLHAVVDGTSDAIYVKDRQGRYLLLNSAATKFVDKAAAEIIGHDDTFLFRPEEAEIIKAEDQATLLAPAPLNYEEHVTGGMGEPLVFHTIKGPLYDERRELIGLFGISRDITARKKAEAALRESEAFNHAIINSITSEIAVLDGNGVIVLVNEAWLRFAGENGGIGGQPAPRTGVGTNYLAACRSGTGLPEYDDAVKAHTGIAAVLAGRLPGFRLEYSCHGPDQKRWFMLSATSLASGDCQGAVVTHTNITERKQTEEALRMSERRHRAFIETSLDGILLGTADGRILAANASACRLFECTEQELCQRGRRGILDLNDARWQFAVAERERTGSFRGELNFKRKNGVSFPAEISTSTFHIENGEARTSVIIRDVSERKKSELALRESEEKFAKVFRDAPVLICLSDLADGTYVDVNDEALRVAGFTREEVIGRTAVELGWIAPEDRAQLRQRVVESGRVSDLEVTLRNKSGDCRNCLVNGEPIVIGGRSCLLTVAVDITMQKRTEKALRESEDRYRLVERAVNDGLWDWDPFTQKTYISRRWKEILGYADTELSNDEVSFFGRIHPEDQAGFGEELRKHLEGNDRYEDELRLRHKNGSYRWVLSRGEAIRDAGGRPVRMVGAITDITDRKQAEQTLQASLSEKEALLKEVHHRVKNNLQIITSLLRLEAGRTAQPDTKTVLSDMQGRIRSMAMLHEALYRSGTFASVDLGSYLKQVATQLFRALVAAPGAIKLHLELDTVAVDMDQAMPCGLVVTELVSNSLKHAFPGDRGGEVRVVLHRVGASRQLCLQVSDNGIGLPANGEWRRSQALGLKLVDDLSRQVEGALKIGSGPGASFEITFVPRLKDVAPGLATTNTL